MHPACVLHIRFCCSSQGCGSHFTLQVVLYCVPAGECRAVVNLHRLSRNQHHWRQQRLMGPALATLGCGWRAGLGRQQSSAAVVVCLYCDAVRTVLVIQSVQLGLLKNQFSGSSSWTHFQIISPNRVCLTINRFSEQGDAVFHVTWPPKLSMLSTLLLSHRGTLFTVLNASHQLVVTSVSRTASRGVVSKLCLHTQRLVMATQATGAVDTQSVHGFPISVTALQLGH
jgi:hypothetical protein